MQKLDESDLKSSNQKRTEQDPNGDINSPMIVSTEHSQHIPVAATNSARKENRQPSKGDSADDDTVSSSTEIIVNNVDSSVNKMNDNVQTDVCDDDHDSVISDISGLSDTFPDILVKRVLRNSKADNPSVPSNITPVTKSISAPLKSSISSKSSTTLKNTSKQKQLASSTDDDQDKMFEFDFRVSFKNVHVREYERILGDNPACSSGPSISIGWEYKPEETFTVEEWECNRDDILYKELSDLAIGPRERIIWLQGLGYTDKEIEQCMKEISTIKQHRMKTAQSTFVQKTEEVLVTAKIQLDKLFRGKRHSPPSKTKKVNGTNVASYAA